jgi:hypothetical protein
MSNYLADGLQGGFQAGYGAMTQKQRDKKLAEDQLARDAKAAQAQIDLEKTRDANQTVRDAANNTFTATRDAAQFGYQGARDDKLNANDMTKLDKTQTFQGEQTQKELDARASIAAAQNTLEAQKIAQSGDQFNRGLAQSGSQFDAKLGWEKDPNNYENQAHAAYAFLNRNKAGEFGGDFSANIGAPKTGAVSSYLPTTGASTPAPAPTPAATIKPVIPTVPVPVAAPAPITPAPLPADLSAFTAPTAAHTTGRSNSAKSSKLDQLGKDLADVEAQIANGGVNSRGGKRLFRQSESEDLQNQRMHLKAQIADLGM